MKDVFWKEQTLKEKSDQLNIENNRKTEELAAAREIQLSMLPNELPDYDDYLFAFSMNPASEVGGDYYDYCITDKNRMTFGIGDATGHGLQASLMVTAIKLLFSEHAGRTEIVQFLKQASHSISLMGFRKIYLAFAIGRLENHTLELAGAGMPHALIFHKKTGCVEQIALKGLPLGNNVQFPYHKTEIAMESGDMVLMMTDGLPELYDSNGKMIGYQKVSELFYENAHLKPTELIENLNYYAKNWVNGTLQNDDITFFAFKRL